MKSFLMGAVAAGVVGVTATASVAGAQQPAASSTQMVLMRKAPVSTAPLGVRLPRLQEATLPNGLRIFVVEDHRTPQVSVQLMIPGAGGYHDPADRLGTAEITAAMMREGTATRSSTQLAEALERMGSSFSVSAGAAATVASISGAALTSSFEPLLDIMTDVLLHPAFAEQELKGYKARAKATLMQLRTNPNLLAMERLERMLYEGHPGERYISTASAIDQATQESLREYHRTRYVPDHAVIGFAGDITLAQARMMVTQRLSEWNKSGAPLPTVTPHSSMSPRQAALVSRPGSVQTTLFIGAPAPARASDEYITLGVANRVLGGTMGRLFRHLREEKGYTYGVGSQVMNAPYVGPWVVNTSVRTQVTEPALTDLLAEMELLRSTPVPADELADAKRASIGSFALSLESPQQVLGYYLESWLYGLPRDYWTNFTARIGAVSAADARAAAQKFWAPERLQIVAVGDTSKIRELMAKTGTLSIYDTEGKRLP